MESTSRGSRQLERWRRWAERMNDNYGLVLLLVLLTYVLMSLLDNRGWSTVVVGISTGATTVVALTSSQSDRVLVRRALFLSLLAILLTAIGAAVGDHHWLDVGSLIQISLLVVAMGAVLRRVATEREVSFRTILGALSVYAVLGLFFTFIYAAVERLQGGAFFEGVADPRGSDFIFFSYTTLTTTGFGNLVPGGQPGRMITGLEMMLGQIFLVTLVAGLVSLWRPGAAILGRRSGSGRDA